MEETVTLRYGDKEYEFPVVEGSLGEKAINIARLRSQTGLVTLDNGYVNTASCQSAITFLDGEKGILRYRGIAIEELAEKSSFVETSYLLIYGHLPTKKELTGFTESLKRHAWLHEDMKLFYDGFPRNAHPMGTLSSAVAALASFHQDSYDPTEPGHRELTIHRLLAKLPTIAAFSYKKSIGQPSIYPHSRFDYTTNFLHMMFALPSELLNLDPAAAKAMDLIFLLHADHEQNCSTSTVRMVGSSEANAYAAVSAGISALWGRLHGGANQAVLEMLHGIMSRGGDTAKFIEVVKKKDSKGRLMGFGHRVYKNFDPRAKILKKACDEVLSNLRVNDPLFDVAKKLEEAALHDEYFISRNLYPNVDFYSGIILKAIGIPLNMFTVMFAIGRLPGWLAQCKEMRLDPDTKIGRPRQIYTGVSELCYVPIEARG